MVNEEALNFIPSRHYAAYIIGLFPSIYDWVTNVSGRAPLTNDGTYNTNTPGGPGFVGILAWKRGALLVSMVWVAMLVNVIDRQWKTAAIWSAVAALFALFGILHVPEAGFENFTSPVWEQCTAGADGAECYDYAQQWMFFVAYCMLGATFVILMFVEKFDESIPDPIDGRSKCAVRTVVSTQVVLAPSMECVSCVENLIVMLNAINHLFFLTKKNRRITPRL